jgi:hypothetical protein
MNNLEIVHVHTDGKDLTVRPFQCEDAPVGVVKALETVLDEPRE